MFIEVHQPLLKRLIDPKYFALVNQVREKILSFEMYNRLSTINLYKTLSTVTIIYLVVMISNYKCSREIRVSIVGVRYSVYTWVSVYYSSWYTKLLYTRQNILFFQRKQIKSDTHLFLLYFEIFFCNDLHQILGSSNDIHQVSCTGFL